LASLAIPSLLHYGINSGIADKQQRSKSWCHGGIVGCSLPSCAMAMMAVAQRMECNSKSGGCVDGNALALMAVPPLHYHDNGSGTNDGAQ
jgi:hypothetical protein